jgi:glycosyltransferase involved in cell wall biosynthesis
MTGVQTIDEAIRAHVQGALPEAASHSDDVAVRISVVVTARNSARCLPVLLAALERQTLPRDLFEVLVVDDGSFDTTPQVAASSALVRLIRSEKHVGLPRGRNLGIAAAVGDLVAFTDADCVPDDTWLELGLVRMDETDADFLVGGITIPVGTRPTIAALVDSMTYLDQECYAKRGFGAGANLWVNARVFERWGVFNENLEAYGGDDEEFCQRATCDGATLVYAKEVHVIHPPRVRVRSVAVKAYRLGYGLAAHRLHNPGPLGRHPRLFLKLRLYLPRRRITRLERLRRIYQPSPRELVLLYLAQHVAVYPSMVGDLMGELHQLRQSLRLRVRKQRQLLPAARRGMASERAPDLEADA